MLTITNLKKSFGELEVLKGVTLTVNSGEVVTIEGPSGEGKTTFLRCIAGLERADSGEITIDQKTLYREKQKQNTDVGLVFQGYELFPHFSVLQNLIKAPLYLKMGTKEELTNKAKELLKKLGIGNKVDNYPYQLSGGQKQRVAIARACMLNPKVLCFDEPTAALDQKSTQEIMKLILSLQSKDLIILVVSHDIDFTRKLTKNNFVIEKGILKEKTQEFVNKGLEEVSNF